MFLFIFVCVCVCVCVLGGGTYIFHFCAVNFEVFETFILECSECVRNHLHGHRNERLLCATFVSFWLFDWYNTEKMRGVGGNIYTHTHAYERSFFSLSLSLSPCIQLNYAWCLRISTATITSSNSDCSRIHVLFSFSPTRVFSFFLSSHLWHSIRSFATCIPVHHKPTTKHSCHCSPFHFSPLPTASPFSLFLSLPFYRTLLATPPLLNVTHTHTREMMSVSLSLSLPRCSFPPSLPFLLKSR